MNNEAQNTQKIRKMEAQSGFSIHFLIYHSVTYFFIIAYISKHPKEIRK